MDRLEGLELLELFKRQDRLVDLRGLSCLRILRGWRARRELVGLGSLSCLSCSRGWVSRETVCHAQAGPKSSTKIVPSIGTKSETIFENSWEAGLSGLRGWTGRKGLIVSRGLSCLNCLSCGRSLRSWKDRRGLGDWTSRRSLRCLRGLRGFSSLRSETSGEA